jgi:hypothetical protein
MKKNNAPGEAPATPTKKGKNTTKGKQVQDLPPRTPLQPGGVLPVAEASVVAITPDPRLQTDKWHTLRERGLPLDCSKMAPSDILKLAEFYLKRGVLRQEPWKQLETSATYVKNMANKQLDLQKIHKAVEEDAEKVRQKQENRILYLPRAQLGRVAAGKRQAAREEKATKATKRAFEEAQDDYQQHHDGGDSDEEEENEGKTPKRLRMHA